MVGPSGTIFNLSINDFLFGDITLTKIDLLSWFQFITSPKFAFNIGFVNLDNFPVSIFNIQSSTPSLVVLVRATFFWSGDQEMLLNFAFSGNPLTCEISCFFFFKFLILMLL